MNGLHLIGRRKEAKWERWLELMWPSIMIQRLDFYNVEIPDDWFVGKLESSRIVLVGILPVVSFDTCFLLSRLSARSWSLKDVWDRDITLCKFYRSNTCTYREVYEHSRVRIVDTTNHNRETWWNILHGHIIILDHHWHIPNHHHRQLYTLLCGYSSHGKITQRQLFLHYKTLLLLLLYYIILPSRDLNDGNSLSTI